MYFHTYTKSAYKKLIPSKPKRKETGTKRGIFKYAFKIPSKMNDQKSEIVKKASQKL